MTKRRIGKLLALAIAAAAACGVSCGKPSPSTPGTNNGTTAASAVSADLVDRHTWKFANKSGYSYDMSVSLSRPLKFSEVRGDM